MTVSHRKRSPFLWPRAFHRTNRKTIAISVLPAQFLNYGGRVYRNRAFSYIRGHAKSVARAHHPNHNAPVLPSGALSSHQNEPARQRARELINTLKSSPKHSGKERKVEALFAGIEESDRIAALASAETQVRARAQFFAGSGDSEPSKRLVRFLDQHDNFPLLEAAPLS